MTAWYTCTVVYYVKKMREMTVNLTGEFFKDFSQKQDGRFPAGEEGLY